MSFSSELKKELGEVYDKPRHCRIAELRAIVGFIGKKDEGGSGIVLSSDNSLPVNVSAGLVKKIFSVQAEVDERKGSRKKNAYVLDLNVPEGGERIYQALKLQDASGELKDPGNTDPLILISKRCCKCAYLRGAFISAGTISDPDKFYNLEILCRTQAQADILVRIISDLGAKARTAARQRYIVVYVKDSNMISDLLGYMGARVCLLELENTRIIRGTRGNVNRRVNCETANIGRTAAAAASQIAAIEKIDKYYGLSSLPDGLDEIARLRVEYPAATLQELGQMLDKPIGKSGVNHRLRKIVEISEKCNTSEET